jgi:alpha-amylase
MVGWHNYVGKAKVAHGYDDGDNLIAFSRGNKGWISINNSTRSSTRSFQTGLAATTFCDIICGDLTSGKCTGNAIKVHANGRAEVTVGAKSYVRSLTATGSSRL